MSPQDPHENNGLAGQTGWVKSDRYLPIAVGLDTFVVVLFVSIGRRNHQGSSALGDVLETGAPFLIGLAVAWLVTRAWRRPVRVLTGLAIWPMTLLVGMIARRALFDRGTATSFVIVATIFLGAFLVGWRVAFRSLERRQRTQELVSRRVP